MKERYHACNLMHVETTHRGTSCGVWFDLTGHLLLVERTKSSRNAKCKLKTMAVRSLSLTNNFVVLYDEESTRV